MSLILETGIGVSNANAYVDISYVDNYLLERGINDEWDLLNTDTLKESHIINATEYIELRFQNLFVGEKLTSNQSLSFPRKYGDDKEDLGSFPEAIKKANSEYAYISLTGTLLKNTSDQLVKREKSKVGPIETETEYQDPKFLKENGLYGYFPIHRKADSFIKPFLKNKQIRLIR